MGETITPVFLIGLLAAGLILYALVASSSGGKRRKGGYRGSRSHAAAPHRGFVDPVEIKPRWDLIMATSATGASGLKSALNDADKLFDQVMRQVGFPGETFGERLKGGRNRFSTYGVYDAVWRAHKLRNSMAHDMHFDLVVSQVKEALADFERGLRDLKAL
jgi:hypothetical protein